MKNHYKKLQKAKDRLAAQRQKEAAAVADFKNFLSEHIMVVYVGDKK